MFVVKLLRIKDPDRSITLEKKVVAQGYELQKIEVKTKMDKNKSIAICPHDYAHNCIFFRDPFWCIDIEVWELCDEKLADIQEV